MKQLIKKISILLCLLGFLALPCFVFAAPPLSALDTVGNSAGYAKAGPTTVATIAGTIINIVLSFLGIIFVVLIIYAGILWMTAQGDEAKVEKAQKIMSSAIIGLIITISCWAIYLVAERVFSPTTVKVQQATPAP
jgi:uncharacterized protein with PQ loop repeat